MDRRQLAQQVGLERREGERRQVVLQDGLLELRATTARHKRIQDALRRHTDEGVTDWQARYLAARQGVTAIR